MPLSSACARDEHYRLHPACQHDVLIHISQQLLQEIEPSADLPLPFSHHAQAKIIRNMANRAETREQLLAEVPKVVKEWQ